MKKIARYFASVKKELKKVRWPKRKEITPYSIATIALLVFFMLFFVFSDFIIGVIVKVFN